MKKCFVCGQEKPLEDFYRHPMMADGHLGKCKECTKVYMRERQRAGLTAEYDKKRYQRPERKAAVAARARRWAKEHPERRRAQSAVGCALKKGILIRPNHCQQCGQSGKIHAHHHDYSKPLEVEWLCVRCHGARNPNYITE